uniref:Uncharacterized protein n=1 Tax=Peronospora matthiolae TaxID=2874970 RepID=A0AAV1UEK6_9STRA
MQQEDAIARSLGRAETVPGLSANSARGLGSRIFRFAGFSTCL